VDALEEVVLLASESLDVFVVLVSESFLVDGLPSSPMVNVGRPTGGGTTPPAPMPAPGMTMIPTPDPTYQMGRMVVCPLFVVVVAEFAVNPWIDFVTVAYAPAAIDDVLGLGVIGPVLLVTVVVGTDALVEDPTFGPPSSPGASPLLGNTPFLIEYVSPARLQDPPQKLSFEMHCSMMFLKAAWQDCRSLVLSVLETAY
jgi:hypothetical protein